MTVEVSAWRHSPDVAQVVDGDRFVVLDLARPATPPRVLSGPAAVIWSCVDGLRGTPAVAEAVAASVEVSVEEVHDDVAAFLTELRDSGLLVGGLDTGGRVRER